MKVLWPVLALVVAAVRMEYSNLLMGVLEGSRLVATKDLQLCDELLSVEADRITLEVLVDDLISLAKSCGWESAAKSLSKFLGYPSLTLKASQDLDFFFSILQTRPRSAQRQDGLFMGKVLEYRIASMSPYVNKFGNEVDKDVRTSEATLNSLKSSPYPIAVFHGLGDCCCFPGMIEFTKYLGKQVGTYSKCVEVGDGPPSSWLMGFQKQVDAACTHMQGIAEFANGVNVVGLSQGGLIARAMAEMCNVTVHTVVTMGGPHMGVMSIPNCETGFFCDIFNDIVDIGVYDTFVQENSGPPGYYKDPLIYEEYLKQSAFLAAANNEKVFNQNFANGFKALDKLVLIEFTEDTVVDPKTSEWFGYFEVGSKTVLQNYNETADYLHDILGLQTLDKQGKIVFESIVGNHLQFNNSEVDRTVIPYLK